MPFGHGFISGLVSAILGIAGFGAVLCLHFPQYLTQVELRRFYSLDYLRAIIHLALIASFLLGTVSAFLRANKALALTGIGFTLAAALLGGSQVPIEGEVGSPSWLGLDFFVLNLAFYQYFVRSQNQAGNLLLGEPLDGAGNRIGREVSAVAAVRDLRRISALSMRFPD